MTGARDVGWASGLCHLLKRENGELLVVRE